MTIKLINWLLWSFEKKIYLYKLCCISMADRRIVATTKIVSSKMIALINQKTKKSQEAPKFQGNGELSHIWKVYFDIAWFVGFSPFRIIQEGYNPLTYTIKRSWLQNIFCNLVTFMVTIASSYQIQCQLIRLNLDSHGIQKDMSVVYFKATMLIFQFLVILLTLKQFWLNQQDFVDIVNRLCSTHSFLPCISDKIILKVKVVFVVAFLVLSIADACIEQLITYASYVTGDAYWDQMCSLGRSLLFSENICMRENKTNQISFMGTVLATVVITGFILK